MTVHLCVHGSDGPGDLCGRKREVSHRNLPSAAGPCWNPKTSIQERLEEDGNGRGRVKTQKS